MIIAGILGSIFFVGLSLLFGWLTFVAFRSTLRSEDIMDLIIRPVAGIISGLLCLLFFSLAFNYIEKTVSSITLTGLLSVGLIIITILILFRLWLGIIKKINRNRVDCNITTRTHVTNLSTGETKVYIILDDYSLQLSEKFEKQGIDLATVDSPIGQALLGKKVGMTVTAELYNNTNWIFKILKIEKHGTGSKIVKD